MAANTKPPREWVKQQLREMEEFDPDYDEKSAVKTLDNIWFKLLDDDSRQEIWKNVGRTGNPNKRGRNMISRLWKLAYSLDTKGFYSEADEIERLMKSLAERVGLKTDELVTLADYCDDVGCVEAANVLDGMIKGAK